MPLSKIEKYGKLLGEWKIKKVLYENKNGTMVLQIYKLGTDWEENCALKVVPIIDEYGDWNQLSKEMKESYLKAKLESRRDAEKEVRLMYTLRGCSNIVPYYDYMFDEWSEDNSFGCDLLIRMELLDCLRTRMHTNQYSEKEIIKIGIDICKALVNCHKKDIIHRDIKPGNIFINEFGDYLLGDFGISRIVNNVKRASTSTGTIEYMAPEQIRESNSENYGLTVDIYSLGLTLYELANGGKLPFANSIRITQAENALRLSGKRLPVPSGVGEELANIILKACEYDVSNRYQSAGEMLQELIWLGGERTEKEKTERIINRNKVAFHEEQNDAYATVPAETVSAGSSCPSAAIADEDDKDKIIATKDEKTVVRRYEMQQRIVVMGIGGCGNNEINRFLEKKWFQNEIELIAINTDKNALALCKSDNKMLLGENMLNGSGVNANPELAKAAAEESASCIQSMLEGVGLLFLVCGMGGGTGTGATPIIAKIAKEMGILTVALVSTPFRFEDGRRKINAERGINELAKYADTVIVAPNDLLLELVDRDTAMPEAFSIFNTFWTEIIIGIVRITRDKCDSLDTFKGKGIAKFSYAFGDSVKEAAEEALNQSWVKNERKSISEAIYFVSNRMFNDEDLNGLSSLEIPFHVSSSECESEDDEVLVIAVLYITEQEMVLSSESIIARDLKQAMHEKSMKEIEANEFMNYGCKYACEHDFEISELGVLALHSKIKKMMSKNSTITKEDIEGIVEDAMANVRKKKLIRRMLKSDKVLRKCDFKDK